MKTRIEEALRRRHRKGDEGFTLIELLVVILIIAILAAVGIIALLSALNSGRKSAATTVLRNAVTSVRAEQTGQGQTHFGGITLTDFQDADPDINWVDGATEAAPGNNVSIAVAAGPGDSVFMASQSDTEVCYYVQLNPNPGAGETATSYASAAAGCDATGNAAAGLAAADWERDTSDGWDE